MNYPYPTVLTVIFYWYHLVNFPLESRAKWTTRPTGLRGSQSKLVETHCLKYGYVDLKSRRNEILAFLVYKYETVL